MTALGSDADPLAIAIDVGARLDALDVPWVTAGSIASSVHGEPRSTMDVDMVVGLRGSQVAALARSLGADFYVDAEVIRAAVRSAQSFNAVHLASAIKVDFFVAGSDPFEAERLAKRIRVETPLGALWVDTAEHTLVRKLEWYRRGGEVSERQWRDVQAIIRLQADALDRQVLHRWADRLGVADLLTRALDNR